ncbi:tetratricopeptide repeat protein (macronuclear) [Tetrahymena thermophila SB210]|uniref:Tetratricopeptide repeat protein n=1 Tax=Tetrahymena thermophila (strain SB210) TaxID=312017 RepID=Q23D85_TETTS|nr:tetratricopeptide repeat protein [Tetrahymena thermophila SB210]EAR94619.2 tetratricopeptide repeat protein [Tetrahymena thermophila SB210]|eukprot:XP_001014801.2 tetratricopeptide repeat protein [Tetrahymena thermophila SB210]
MFLRGSINLLKNLSKSQINIRNNQQLLSQFIKFNFCVNDKQSHQHQHQHVHVHTKDCNHDHDHDHDHHHGHNHIHEHEHGKEHETSDFNKQQEINPQDQQIMQTTEEYTKALQFYSQGKYRISHEFFRRTIESIKKSGQQGSSDHICVLKKMVSNQIQLRRYQEAENTIEEIIEILQKKSTTDSLIYKEYNNLFLHCLKYNLNKAIILGKALLSEKEKKNIPAAYQKIFTFNLGTAYLLRGNFIDAKQRLRECIMQDPNPLLRGYALNNLAVACWWHKHPNLRDLIDFDEIEDSHSVHSKKEQPIYSFQQIDADFDNVIPLFKKAIWYIENVDQVKELQQRIQYKQLLESEKIIPSDLKKFDPNTSMILTKQECGIPLLNIQEFIFHTSPQKRFEATFWFKYALRFFETVDPNNIERCLITLGVFCTNYNDVEKAEGLFKQALEMIGENDNYNKILCLQMYGSLLQRIPNRETEGDQLMAQAHKIAEVLPFWFRKLNYVIIPKLDLS